MLPGDVKAEDTPPVEVELPGPTRSWTRHLRWLVVLAPLVLAVWWLGQDQSRGFGSKVLAPNRSFGELGVLENPSGGALFVTLDPESAKVLYKVGDEADGDELRFLIEQGRAVEMRPGTSVRVLESNTRGRVVRVRIISGPWESRKVWVPTRWVR